MAEDRSTLLLEKIDGLWYVTNETWPESFAAAKAWLTTGLDPHRMTWSGDKLNLYLENGNAVYTIGEDFSPDAESVTLHKLYGPKPDKVPGRELTPEQADANKAEADDALRKMTDLLGPGGGTSDPPGVIQVGRPQQIAVPGQSILTAPPLGLDPQALYNTAPLENEWFRYDGTSTTAASPLTRALMGASNPRSVRPPTGPVPGGSTADEIASRIVQTPGFLDTIYERFKAEQKIERASWPYGTGGGGGAGGYVNLNTRAVYPTAFPAIYTGGLYNPSTGYQATTQPPFPAMQSVSHTVWADYLTDILAFLSTVKEASEFFGQWDFKAQYIGSGEAIPAKISVQDPVGFMGEARLSDLKGFSDLAPREYDVREFFSQAAKTMKELMGRANELQRRVDPEKSLSDAEQAIKRVDDGVIEEINELQGATPHGSSAYAVQQARHDAWDKWAARESGEKAVDERMLGERGREYLKDIADYVVDLADDDTLTLKATNGPVKAYVTYDTGRNDDPEGFLVQQLEERAVAQDDFKPRTWLDRIISDTPPKDVAPGETVSAEAISLGGQEYRFRTDMIVNDDGSITADPERPRDNLVDYERSDVSVGGNGQMGGDE